MKAKKTQNGYFITLARGEDVVGTLTALCEQEGIHAAVFTGIGAVERVKIGYYALETKEYFFRDEPGVFEVASMTGNVALVENKPFIHVHAVLSRADESCECIGAHIKEAFVAVTLEIHMQVLDIPLERQHDEDIGLKLLHL